MTGTVSYYTIVHFVHKAKIIPSNVIISIRVSTANDIILFIESKLTQMKSLGCYCVPTLTGVDKTG